MIRLESAGPSLSLEVDLRQGELAFLDREWLEGTAGSTLPALIADANGRLEFRGTILALQGEDPSDAAFAALAAIAWDAVEALAGMRAGSIEVLGEGLVAREVSRLVADRRAPDTSRPAAIIDTTGRPEVIRSALERLDDLGRLVLAGETPGGSMSLELYPDMHARSLTLIGVPPPLSALRRSRALPKRPVEACLPVVSGEPLPAACWYVVRR